MVSGEATRLQEPFWLPSLCDRIKSGFCWVTWGSVTWGHSLCVTEQQEVCRQQKELSGLPCEDVSGLRIQEWRSTVQGAAQTLALGGQRQRQEQAGKLCPDLERGHIDRPLDLWRLLSFLPKGGVHSWVGKFPTSTASSLGTDSG